MGNLTDKQKKEQLEQEIITAYAKFITNLINLDLKSINSNSDEVIFDLERDLHKLKIIAMEHYGEEFFTDSIKKAKSLCAR